MPTFSQTITRMSRLMFLGFRGPMARQMKRLIVCQWIALAVFLFLWIKFNGGLWPSFLQSRSDSGRPRILDVNLADHFVAAQHDGSMITWAHATNSRELLKQALMSENVMMIEADVILRGQSTEDQQMMPIMARLPDVTSDLTLAEWLSLVKGRGKGVKLDFKSIEAVEISLQNVNEIKHELNAPLHLSAAVLDSSNEGPAAEQALDAGRFMRLCTTHAPDCTLALGWATPTRCRRYNWTDVKAMYDLLDRWHVTQPITFNVRADLVRRSMPQLKWLLEMTSSSTMTVISSVPASAERPANSVHDLVYVRRRVPRHALFYDLPRSQHVEFSSVKDTDITDRHDQDIVQLDEERSFNADQWKVVHSRDGEMIYLGTQSVLLQTGLLITKAEYPATPQKPVYITGRVEFLRTPVDDHSDDKPAAAGDSRQDEIGLAVFLRVSQSSRPDSISGIRCFFGMSGEIRLDVQRIPGVEARAKAVLPGNAPCLAFSIKDSGVGGISAFVSRPKSCDSDFDVETDVDFKTTVDVPLAGVTTDSSYVAIKQSIPVGFTAIDQFTVASQKPTSRTL